MSDFTAGSGIEVCFPEDWFINSPICCHGPMLLFEKFVQGHSDGRKYYSCSACRNRKDCNAFIYEDDYIIKAKQQEGRVYLGQPPRVTHCSRYKFAEILSTPMQERAFCKKCQREKVLSTPMQKRAFCKKCQCIVINKDKEDASGCSHLLERNLSDFSLFHPSKTLLSPIQEDKKNAQYFLNDRSLEIVLEILIKLEFTHIACIGMPTLHEEIQYRKYKNQMNSSNTVMDSILLDIDKRYEQFTFEDNFCCFNMFNHHFVDKSSDKLNRFIQGSIANRSKLCVVLDPPFGGLVDAITETLKWISTRDLSFKFGSMQKDNLLPILWIFPYFMEKRITKSLPTLKMCDYQVNYENHSKFKRRVTSCRISPVRIFTNIDLCLIPLPEDEGYRFCSMCNRYVADTNSHCYKCNTCPSKDGRTYTHCEKCGFCIKPGRIHCLICDRCELSYHECRKPEDLMLGCHLCGKLTHKRRDCPLQKIQKLVDNTTLSYHEPSCVDHVVFHKKSSHFRKRKYNLYS